MEFDNLLLKVAPRMLRANDDGFIETGTKAIDALDTKYVVELIPVARFNEDVRSHSGEIVALQ